ncbi:MAG: polysaccharide deacetylase family protein [Patescibacteria group bacterium]
MNYHYVEDPHPSRRGIHPCPIARFERHLAYLSENFRIVSVEEVVRAARESRGGAWAAITFDDGLRDQYTNAVPLLKKYGVTAAFFPITLALTGTVPPTHKLHILLSASEADVLVDLWNEYAGLQRREMGAQDIIPKDRYILRKSHQHDDVLPANLKAAIARAPRSVKNGFLDTTFKNLGISEESALRELFMSEEELATLSREGFTIGSHSHGHDALDSVSSDLLRQDIRESKRRLENLLGVSPTVFSYPYGRYSPETRGVVQKEGFCYAVTTDRRGITAGEDSYSIPRFDANDVGPPR